MFSHLNLLFLNALARSVNRLTTNMHSVTLWLHTSCETQIQILTIFFASAPWLRFACVCRLCACTVFFRGDKIGFVCPAVFPLSSSPLSLSLRRRERGATARKGRRRRWRGEWGGHSIGTPRHSEGNHPKYFPLCVARASRLLLHTHGLRKR